MERTEKETAIGTLKSELAKAASLVLADFRGLTVKADTSLRREFRLSGCHYQVVKNSILGLAVKGTPMEGIEGMLVGPTAIAYSFEDPAIPAKVATKLAKAVTKFVIKGGFVEGRALDIKGVEALSSLPGKDELRATLLATFMAGPQNFVRLLNAAPQNFAYLLAAREEALKTAAPEAPTAAPAGGGPTDVPTDVPKESTGG
jgi:large subunit ribosomal protein L10